MASDQLIQGEEGACQPVASDQLLHEGEEGACQLVASVQLLH